MDLGLGGRRALVTGGSAGIGLAVARTLAEEGAEVAIVARTEDRLRAAAERLSSETGARVVAVPADVRDAEAVDAAVATAVAELGGLEILVHSGARVSGTIQEDLAHVTEELMLGDFDEKVVGAFRLARAAIPHMRAAGFGRIVNIGGLSYRSPASVSAGARNSALVHLTATLAAELGKDGITANVVHPGATLTEGVRERIAARAAEQGIPEEQAIARAGARSAVGRAITVEELADVVVFLASPRSASITGETISAGGGSTAAVWY